IQSLYGSSSAVQTKIKIDKKRDDIETRRALITKEIGYKSNYLRGKISQNELILGVLNVFIGIVPLVMAYILNDIIKFESAALRSKVLFLIACCFIIITVLLKQGQFLTLQNKSRNKVTSSSVLIQRLCMLSSCSIFALVLIFAVTEVYFHKYNLPELIPQMLILCSALCIFLGIFSGFTKNIISDSAEELDKCESREDFQAVIKDYQQWITLYINNISGKKLRDMQNKIFNLQIKSGAEYLLGIITAPFLAYGVSQTLAECFPEAAAWIRFNAGFKISPIFLTLATLMIIFAFHCFATSFSITKKIAASNVIKQDGFSDYNTHGTTIYGVEGSKNLKKEAGKFLLIAIAVIAIELTMNISYFIGVMGGDVMSVVLSIIAALVPTTILIMETSELGKTKFAISVREELIDKIDKDF
ncbi:MAG: hypothetical protein LUG16_03825, partial [Candidatus Gastranaerophilales bacterium]|nr:hypothetical protein [Candidatus Gastranaerophilales bacterium]